MSGAAAEAASAVGAVVDETVGVGSVVDAVVTVGGTVVAVVVRVVGTAAVCAVDAVSVAVGAGAAAELQTFPGDAVSVAGQQVNQFDYL